MTQGPQDSFLNRESCGPKIFLFCFLVTLILFGQQDEEASIRIHGNPVPFVSPTAPLYYEAQNLNASSVAQLRQITEKLLAPAISLRGELQNVELLCNFVATTLRHPAFDDGFKKKRYHPKFVPFCHDPVRIFRFCESFLPIDPNTWPSPECTMQNDVLIGLLNTIGLHGRVHNIPGHVAGEYYSPTYRKWVYIDSTFNEYFVDRASPTIPLSTLELMFLAKQGKKSRITPHPCGTHPGKSYLDNAPTGFDCAFIPKMWMATFDLGEKKNTRPNLCIYGETKVPFFTPYPKTNRRADVDFPLGLIRVEGAKMTKNKLFLHLTHCIPYFSHYEQKTTQNQVWHRFDGSTWQQLGSHTREIVFRGVDQAGFPSPEVTVEVIEAPITFRAPLPRM